MTARGKVLVLQHQDQDRPAYLGTWLDRHGVHREVRNTEAGDPFPERIDGWRALAILGGEMGANDDLPSLRAAESLIRQAVERGVPVLGHCLGGQLMARALGARVGRSPRPEAGWHRIDVHEVPPADRWLGDAGAIDVFQWHRDAFELPRGAVALASSEACPVQAFSLGPHLAMQFHVEVDQRKLGEWADARDLEAAVPGAPSWPSVHDGRRMRADAARCLPRQQALADAIYARWLSMAT